MDLGDTADQISKHTTAATSHLLFYNQNLTMTEPNPGSQQHMVLMDPQWHSSSSDCTDLVRTEEGLSNGTCEVETVVESHCFSSGGGATPVDDLLVLSDDGVPEISNNDLSLPEVCISTNSSSFEEDMNYEVQQAYRIFSGFLLDKHKGIAGPFLHPVGHLEAQHGIGGVRGRGQAQLRQSMCLRRMEEKFVGREYETIAEFVADFRLMLENCYRYHGVDHWISKQAQKLEIMLEQKLTLLSRTLREKTTLAVTSKGRFGAEEERGSGGTSTRRRSAPRSLSTITVGGHESIMVQSLRLEEQQRAKEERRQRDLEKKEAEETSAKQVEEWEHSLLSQASPQTVNTLWELPAIGHFLCLAQTALNLPEIVFFELERCLLMPRCSVFLSKIMSSLLCPPQRRTTLHRRPALPYRRWESELRQRVLGWYRAMGASQDQPGRAELLGLCLQFFRTLGEESPLEETPFHLLPFYQRVWLLKGLCDNVYETQKDVQDAVLGQPIHECRESILGYDGEENAYIHFPHFCGADLRIYCQSPCSPPTYPFPPVWVKRTEPEPGTEGEESDGVKEEQNAGSRCYGGSLDMGESEDSGEEKHRGFKGQNGGRGVTSDRLNSLSLKAEVEESDSESSDEEDSSEDSKSNLKTNANSSLPLSRLRNSVRGGRGRARVKEEPEHGKREQSSPSDSGRTIRVETQEPCLSVGEHSYTGRSPARSESSATQVKAEAGSPVQGQQAVSCLEGCRSSTGAGKPEQRDCHCGSPGPATRSSSSESSRNSSEEGAGDLVRTKKKRRKRRRGGEQPPGARGGHRQLRHPDRTGPCQANAAKPPRRRTASTLSRKNKRKKNKTGKTPESPKMSKKTKDEPSAQPSFKLVCTSLEHLRDLISKTEDELDELESTKKRLGRWYLRREAVKDLHITLIRLLNELSPWEPKLVKAYQRNRLRLKKDFDDFKKHPEYDNFVREERVSSSSSDDEDSNEGRETCSLPDHYREAEEEDHLEHHVPRGLWTRGDGQFVAESIRGSMVNYMTPNHLKRSLSSTDEELSPLKRGRTGSDDTTTPPVSGLEPRSGLDGTDPPMIVSPLGTAAPAQASLGPRPVILHPTIGLPKGYTPIPTLLAKSVGNKVTLMKRPADYPGIISHVRQSKVQGVTAKPPQAQSPLSQSQQLPQSSQQSHTPGPQQTLVQEQPVTITTAGALHKPPQSNPAQTAVPKSPVQVVYKVPEGLGHLLRKEGSNPVKISVQPVVDQKTGEKIMQQVMILPSNLLLQKAEKKVSSQQQSIQASFSKGPVCMTTNAHGFSIPDARIPVQQVAPLKDTRTARTPFLSISPRQLQGGFKVAQASTPQSVTPNRSPATTLTSVLSTHPSKPTDPKQELKTVCIRDSQSILVTTRGGNTGVVKVQTSSDKNAPGSMPASPVITISPQFKAFLVSKTSTPVPPPAPIQTSSCMVTAATSTTTCQPLQQAHSLLKSPVATVVTAAPGPALVTCTIPLTGPASQVEGTAVTFALNQGHSTSAGSVVTEKSTQPAQTIAAGSHLPTSPVKSDITPNVPALVQCINKPGAKRAGTDKRSQFTKFILVTPSSSANVTAVPKVTSSPTTALSGSRVMFISQSAAATASTPSSTSLGSIPKQTLATGASGQPSTTSISTDTVKMGLTLGQAVGSINSEALSKVQSITLPSGVQIRLPGRTQSLGLPPPPSKNTPVSVSTTGPLAVTSSGLVLVKTPNMVSSSPTQPTCSQSLLHSGSQLHGITAVPQPGPPGPPTPAATIPPLGCVIRKDPGPTRLVLSHTPPAQVNTTAQLSPAKTTTPTLVHPSPTFLGGVGTTPAPVLPYPQAASIVPHAQLPVSSVKPVGVNCNASPVSATPPGSTATVQQRIVINTTTPLAAGTQILLNNTRFVVPPQGLAPGSHVLIISSPVPPPVPSSNATIPPAVAPSQRPSPTTTAPQGLALPGPPPARLPGVPALSSPVAAGTPAVAPHMLAATPNVAPVRLPGAPTLGFPVLPSTTNVVPAMCRLPAPQALASPALGTPTLVSASPRLASTPALVSPMMTTAPALGSALPRLPAGTHTLAQPSPTTPTPTLSPVLASPMCRLPATPPLTSLGLPSTPTISLPTPGMPALAPLPSVVSIGTPCMASTPAARHGVTMTVPGPGTQPQQTALRLPAPSTVSNALQQVSLHTGLTNTTVRQQVATVMQPSTTLAGTRTQVLTTVAIPPIGSTVSRMQTLPVATVPPIGSAFTSLQASPRVTMPPSDSTVIMTPSQPIRAMKAIENNRPPVVLTNQVLGKPPLQASVSGAHANLVSKLLVSPDGAVLNTVQGPVNPAGLPAMSIKPLATLAVSPSSSIGRALPTPLTDNPPPQPAKADTSEPMN